MILLRFSPVPKSKFIEMGCPGLYVEVVNFFLQVTRF